MERLTISPASRAGSRSPARRRAMTPIWRPKRRCAATGSCVFVASDDVHAATVTEAIAFFAPDVSVLSFPAWDCLPYDRVSPKPDIESQRLATLAALARAKATRGPAVVVTTVNAAAAARAAARRDRAGEFLRQGRRGCRSRSAGRLPGRQRLCRAPARCASRAISRCAAALSICGRPASRQPLRLDFFGSTLDAIRRFDAETQLSSDQIDEIELLPASEAPLDAEVDQPLPRRLCRGLRPGDSDDPLYEAVSAGRKQPGHGALAAAVP